MSGMRDEDLRRLLDELPRHRASSTFTERVLDEIDQEPDATRAPWRKWMWLPAAAALIAAVWSSHVVSRQREERRVATERLEQMQTEYRELQRELDQLRSLTSAVEPVIELGGTDDVDFVFDARRFHDPSRGGRAERISHTTR